MKFSDSDLILFLEGESPKEGEIKRSLEEDPSLKERLSALQKLYEEDGENTAHILFPLDYRDFREYIDGRAKEDIEERIQDSSLGQIMAEIAKGWEKREKLPLSSELQKLPLKIQKPPFYLIVECDREAGKIRLRNRDGCHQKGKMESPPSLNISNLAELKLSFQGGKTSLSFAFQGIYQRAKDLSLQIKPWGQPPFLEKIAQGQAEVPLLDFGIYSFAILKKTFPCTAFEIHLLEATLLDRQGSLQHLQEQLGLKSSLHVAAHSSNRYGFKLYAEEDSRIEAFMRPGESPDTIRISFCDKLSAPLSEGTLTLGDSTWELQNGIASIPKDKLDLPLVLSHKGEIYTFSELILDG